MKLWNCVKTVTEEGELGWLIKFKYNKDFIYQFKKEIFWRGRKWDGETKAWFVSELYEDSLDELFDNFETLATPYHSRYLGV